VKLASSSFADLVGHAYDTAADPRCRRHSQAVTTAEQPLRADTCPPRQLAALRKARAVSPPAA